MKRRFVFDTNALVSVALLKSSVSRKAFDHALKTGVILASQSTVTELNEVLTRSKFDRYITASERIAFITAFVSEAEIVAATASIQASRDPDDDKFLDLAISGHADCIVTGDDDLLVLSPFRGILIITPSDFVKQSED